MARIGRERRPARGIACSLLCLGLGAGAAAQPGALPRVASTNLCTDQLVLTLADEAQIATLSWLAADPHESVVADAAARYPLNYGTAEELLRFEPDIVLGGEYTRTFALGLLARLGTDVVTVEPADSVDDIARNLRTVGDAIGRSARAERVIDAMRARERAIAARAPAERPAAVVVRPGGYTVGADSLADELMRLAGLANDAAEHGLDRWGSLSVEALLRSRPDLLVLIDYHRGSPSLANAVFTHPALRELARRTPSVRIDAAHFACGLPQSLDAASTLETAAKRALRR